MNNFLSKIFSMLLVATLASVTLFITSCEGPAGKDGLAGTDGKDGQEQCATCHNSSNLLFAKQLQWENSQHGKGTSFERSAATCAPCHTNDGFLEVVSSGEFNTKAEIMNPTGQNCRTCHHVHRKSDQTDWELTYTGDVKFRMSNTTHNFGKGSVCAMCHQTRALSPMIDITKTDSTYRVGSSHFGPHYSSAANAFVGNGAFEIPGPEPYNKTVVHMNVLQNSCVDCHMGKAYGAQAGGHTMKMKYDNGTTLVDNISVCKGCHTDANVTNFDFYGTQTETRNLLTQLREILVTKKMIDTTSSHGHWEHDAAVPGSYPTLHAAALYNYRWAAADQSWGIHNPKYIKAVIKNAINALQ
ncbi:hypothetical protein MASR1M45_05330 [Candidatus Kapaibacterium sp.]